MATYRPKIGYSAWNVPATPTLTKYRLDWKKIGVWSGILVFCAAVWFGFFYVSYLLLSMSW